MFEKILAGYSTEPGKGLPIGSLTSQYFANYYLDGFDRFLLEQIDALGHVRYMDDVIWWCETRAEAKASLRAARDWLHEERQLSIKGQYQINRSVAGVNFCGFRILPGVLRLSLRRRKRYAEKRAEYERAYQLGLLGELELQQGYSSVLATTRHGDTLSWRKEQLRRRPFLLGED